MSQYSFAETRKTFAAFAGLVGTVIAYVLADNTIRNLLPPNVIAVLGMAGTVLAVFKVSNVPVAPTVDTAAADIARGAQALQTVRDHAVTAVRTVQDLEDVLGAAVSNLGPMTQKVIDSVVPR